MRLRPFRALILFASALLLVFAARSEGEAVFVSRIAWTMEDPEFGGWSGLEVTDDGMTFTAVADRGYITDGRLRRSAAGRLTGVEGNSLRRLGDTAGRFFGRDIRDAEGLAIAADGQVLVSFEVVRRVLSYPDAGGESPTVLPLYRDFIAMRPNMALEALAIGPDGAIYTLPEASRRGGPFPVFRFHGGQWERFDEIENRWDGYRPVGADIGPDGRFYLLERRVFKRIGLISRVRRFDLTASGLANETLVLMTGPATHDNLEGLAVWRDAGGRIRLTMVSDDNFNRWQRTEIVEYLLPE